jgi:pimeloyl-ACP methyl ester carboxylesterase
MTTFGLVHGAWHGAWCWAPVVDELRALGHEAVAMDLPTEDPSAGVEEYAATVLDALDAAVSSTDDDVVVVGHSLGGLTVPVVASRRPVSELIFLCALVPTPGHAWSASDLFTDDWTKLGPNLVNHPDGSSSWPPDVAAELFFHDCPPDLAASSAAKLRRQQWKIAQDPCPIAAAPDVAVRAIVCDDDRALRAATCARLAEAGFGATTTHMSGGHSPFLAQPAALAHLLTAGH